MNQTELRNLTGARRRAATQQAIVEADFLASRELVDTGRSQLDLLDRRIAAGVERGHWTAADIATAFRAAGSVAVAPDLARRLERTRVAV